VPVVDLGIIRQYFDPGYLDHFVRLDEAGRRITGKKEVFYESPSEARDRIASYLTEPPQMRNYREFLMTESRTFPPLDDGDRPFTMLYHQVQLPIPQAAFRVVEGSE
jgi:hypothetical protein